MVRAGYLYVCFAFVSLHASEDKPRLDSLREQRIVSLQKQIAEVEKARMESIECRNESHDAADKQIYTQSILSNYFLIKDLKNQLSQEQSKP